MSSIPVNFPLAHFNDSSWSQFTADRNWWPAILILFTHLLNFVTWIYFMIPLEKFDRKNLKLSGMFGIENERKRNFLNANQFLEKNLWKISLRKKFSNWKFFQRQKQKNKMNFFLSNVRLRTSFCHQKCFLIELCWRENEFLSFSCKCKRKSTFFAFS